MFQRTRNNILSVIFAVALVILIITFSIGLPIYQRWFYYIHVDTLDMPEKSGFTRDEIIEAYDEVLDFLTVPGNEFGTGKLLHSEEGKGHFEDCKVLFDLNKNALVLSFITVVLLSFLDKIGIISLARPFGFRLGFWSSVTTLSLFGIIGALCAVDFSNAFTIFHQIFFPGKSNWRFDPYTDEIIRVMPEKFFMDCAILICVSILLISAILIVRGAIKRRNDYDWRV